jgi:hypothetical protein
VGCSGKFLSGFDRIGSRIELRTDGRRSRTGFYALRLNSLTHPAKYLEKRLQKAIAIRPQNEGWGNDVPTASGLVNDRGRQMNIDLAHQIPDGFEFIELKLRSNTPYAAALQILRYGAVYLFRLEPELVRRFKGNQMLNAKRIVLEVLAPGRYCALGDVDQPLLEAQLDRQVARFAEENVGGLSRSFRLMAFDADFIFKPGMNCDLICEAVRGRRSPFQRLGNAGNQINALTDSSIKARTVRESHDGGR